MHKHIAIGVISGLVLLFCLQAPGSAQNHREDTRPTRIVEYKQVPTGDPLTLHIFDPPGHTSEARVPAIVFFFGGSWRGGNPSQFYEHCRYFASRGMVAISAQYRTENSHGVTPIECVMDAKSAIRWVRGHAVELGVHPNRIAAGGESAGGHVAACTGGISGYDDPSDDVDISAHPNALVLFNPAVNVDTERLSERFQGQARALSPAHNVRWGLPPTIIFHGTDDTSVPISTVEDYSRRMLRAGNHCQLVRYDGQVHGFLNYGRSQEMFRATVRSADEFLQRWGYLQGPATL